MAAVPFSSPRVSLGLGHGSGRPLACTGGHASCWPLTEAVRAGLVSLVLSAFLRLETSLQHQVVRKVTCCLKLMETGDSVTETGWRKVGHCLHTPGSGGLMEEGHSCSGDPWGRGVPSSGVLMGEGHPWFWRPRGGGAPLVLETSWGRGVLGSGDPMRRGAPGSVDSTRRGVTSSEDPLGRDIPVLETPRGGALLVLETPRGGLSPVLETGQGGVLPGALGP